MQHAYVFIQSDLQLLISYHTTYSIHAVNCETWCCWFWCIDLDDLHNCILKSHEDSLEQQAIKDWSAKARRASGGVLHNLKFYLYFVIWFVLLLYLSKISSSCQHIAMVDSRAAFAGRLGYVPGDCNHLWHGDLTNRGNAASYLVDLYSTISINVH